MSHSKTLMMLLAAYALAIVWPDPALFLRLQTITVSGADFGVQHLLLALMLLAAGASCRSAKLWKVIRRPVPLVGWTAFSWLLPMLGAVIVVRLLASATGVPSEVRVALLIVAAMPVANSSVGWASQIGANLAVSISLVLVAVLVSPLITPWLIQQSLTVTSTQVNWMRPEQPMGSDISAFLTVWVLLPMMLGLLIASRMKLESAEQLRIGARWASLAALLMLNYMNGAACLPQFVLDLDRLYEPLLASSLLLVLSWGFSLLLVRLVANSSTVSADPKRAQLGCEVSVPLADTGRSLMLAVVMRNTGAALVYATSTAPSMPLLGLTIIIYTLMQHLFIGVYHAWQDAPALDLLGTDQG